MLMEFLEDFARIFVGITVALVYVVVWLFLIVAPFVWIGGVPGTFLGIFDAIVFLSFTIAEHS